MILKVLLRVDRVHGVGENIDTKFITQWKFLSMFQVKNVNCPETNDHREDLYVQML